MGIRLENICKSYDGVEVLRDVSMTIDDGAFISLLAPTGEGKTSLLRIMCGIEKPDRGRVYYDEVDVTDVPVQRRSISMVYQWFVNYPSMSVFENIASPLRCRRPGPSAAEIRCQVERTARLLKIEGHLEKLPHELSGGQQQRLAIARALAKDADYIFLDEPLTNLDVKLQEELRSEIRGLFAAKGRGAVVYATPQPVEALNLSTEVGFLHRGRLLQYGPVDEVYHRPISVPVAHYFSHPSMNLFPAELHGPGDRAALRIAGDIDIAVGAVVDRLHGRDLLCGIRAHALSLQPGPGTVPISATIELSEVVGSDTELHLRHGQTSFVAWEQGIGHHTMGSTVTAHLDPTACFLFDGGDGALLVRMDES